MDLRELSYLFLYFVLFYLILCFYPIVFQSHIRCTYARYFLFLQNGHKNII